MASETDQKEKQGERHETAMTCEKCGETLRLVHEGKDGWMAECCDPECRTLHQGCYPD